MQSLHIRFAQRHRFFFALSILLAALITSLPAPANGLNSLSSTPAESQTADAAPSPVTPESTDPQSNRGTVLKRLKSRALGTKETKRILATTQHSLDDELSRITLSQAFDLADGGVLLLYENGKGRLYESKVELRAMLDEVEREAQRGPRSVCRDLPQGQKFIEEVPQLVARLPGLLKLARTDLDGSESSLDKVDKALRRLRPQQLLTPEVFGPLTAYVGEVLRNKTNGRWEMRRGTDAERTWEPWIVDPSGVAYAPFAIYKELLEYGRSASLRAFVAVPTTMRDGASPSRTFTLQLMVLHDPEEGEVVTGAPFSATAVSETRQIFANADHIWKKTQSNLFRDSQGRLRREETTSTSLGEATSSVIISDPVAGTSFVLHPDQKTAEQLAKPFARATGGLKDNPNGETTNTEQSDLAGSNLKKEDLGSRIIAGIVVQGRRMTFTIPSGQAGSENPSAIVLETWYSKDLRTVMMSKRNDPWSGETTYQVTKIQPTEPDPALFVVPDGYTVQHMRHGVSPFR